MDTDRPLLLVDNGSLRPESTQSLRRLAAALAARTGREVRAVSLLHSSAVPAEELGGEPAEILEPFLRKQAEAGRLRWGVVPLFLGRSGAITDYLPRRILALRETWAKLDVAIAPVLSEATPDAESRLAAMLAAGVHAVLPADGPPPVVALVDHGSPVAAVAALRDRLAERLAAELGGAAAGVRACSMERRPEPEYAFNEPLLASVLRDETWWGPAGGRVIVSMLFLQPGRHAGPGGDVAGIIAEAAAGCPRLQATPTPLLGERPELIDLLAGAVERIQPRPRPPVAARAARFAAAVAGLTLVAGVVIVTAMTFLLAALFGTERMALELLIGGVRDGLFWGTIWLPGTVTAAAAWRVAEIRRVQETSTRG